MLVAVVAVAVVVVVVVLVVEEKSVAFTENSPDVVGAEPEEAAVLP